MNFLLILGDNYQVPTIINIKTNHKAKAYGAVWHIEMLDIYFVSDKD